MTDEQVEAALKAWSDARVHGFADEHRAMRAALAAAQAGAGVEDALAVGKVRHASYRFGYQNGYAAGIKEVAEDMRKVIPLDNAESNFRGLLIARIRALRPPAAPAGAEENEMDAIARAHKADELIRQEGFAAGIEAAAEDIRKVCCLSNAENNFRNLLVNRIRALRPPAAPAERHFTAYGPMDDATDTGSIRPPLSASEPAGAPSEVDVARMPSAVGRDQVEGFLRYYSRAPYADASNQTVRVKAALLATAADIIAEQAGQLALIKPAGTPSEEEDDPRITGTLRVGYVRFHPGVKTSTVQQAIDRALFDRG